MWIKALSVLVLLAAPGCLSSGGGTGSVDSGGVMWPDRGGGTSPNLPPVVMIGRIVFESETGEACCVAVDPDLLTTDLLVLDDLPAGQATVTIAAFSTDFAPAVPGIADTCSTVVQEGVIPCDPTRLAAPAFESPPVPITIVPGVQVNLEEIFVVGLPFLFAFSPAQDEAVASPLQFDFTVVDPVTSIAADSVVLEVTFEMEEGEPPMFRSITKRVPIELTACDDNSPAPCSPEGTLDLAGFIATGATSLPEGPVEAHITASNLTVPPSDLDFRYPFLVVAEPTATATPIGAESDISEEALAARTDDGADGTPAEARSDAATAASGGSTAGSRSSELARRVITLTPTPTATPAEAQRDTTTATSGGSTGGSRSPELARPLITLAPTPTATPLPASSSPSKLEAASAVSRE